MEMENLILLSFTGVYFLFIGSFIYNFYLSKKMYKLLENIGEVIALTAEVPNNRETTVRAPKEGTMKRLIRQGMDLEGIEKE